MLSLRLPPEIEARLVELARRTGRTNFDDIGSATIA
jgi:predicted DNA-binding protein